MIKKSSTTLNSKLTMDKNLDISFVPLDEIQEAANRLKGTIRNTPLIELDVADIVEDDRRIFLKLDNLQKTGSFKIRGAGNAIKSLIASENNDLRSQGVFTCSAGNFAQGLAYNCKQLQVPCTIVVPDNAPQVKVAAIKRHGATVVKAPYDTWWNVMKTHQYEDLHGTFVHPVCNRDVIAGNGTIGLEIAEELDKVDVVISPFGGGGLSTGIGSAMKALRPDSKLYVCEVETAAPLSTSFAAGQPSHVINHKTSFVDGMGGKSIFPEMWPLAKNLIEDSLILSLDSVAKAVRLLVERSHIVAEGAGAAPVAAALGWHKHELIDLKNKNIVCVVSGGNIDSQVLAKILGGETP